MVEKADQFETKLCSIFDLLESRDSTLLTNWKFFRNLKKLARSDLARELVGSKLKFWFEYQKQIPTLTLIYRQLKSIPPSNSFF